MSSHSNLWEVTFAAKKMRRPSLILILFSIFLAACMPKKQGDDMEDYLNDTEIVDLTLDHGRKWKANSETTIGIRNMIAISDDFKAIDSGDYQYLGTVLMDEYKTIFEKCSMMGDAHKQLHSYLVPLSSQLIQLKACNNDCTAIIEEIIPYLHTYFDYFE